MDITILYTPEFVKIFSKLESTLQEEIKEKISLFKQRKNHDSLKVHKLHGKLRKQYSLSINYKFRILFRYIKKDTAALVSIGDHDIYK